MSRIPLVSYIPATASYQVWHPEEFIINESEDGIVTITSPVTYSNLTISSYYANQNITEEILTSFLLDTTKDYTPLSELRTMRSAEKIWIEGDYKEDNVYWVWAALASANQLIIVSINSEEKLSDEDRHLYTFMIDKMEIYPSEGEE